MTEWTETLSERGMRVNMKKSQVMMVARTEEQVKPIKIMSAGKELMQVESYNYLGTQIHQTGKLQPEIRNRVQKATSAYFAINNIIFGKKEIERKTKTRVQKAIIEPILLYGCESWVPSKNDQSRVNAVQMKPLRRIVGKTRRDRIRNDRIREELQQEPIVKRIEDQQLSWFGHVCRMEESRKTKQFAEARTQGRRPIGRPRSTWEEIVKEVAKKRGKSLIQLRALASERDEYKKWIRGNPPTLQRWH